MQKPGYFFKNKTKMNEYIGVKIKKSSPYSENY